MVDYHVVCRSSPLGMTLWSLVLLSALLGLLGPDTVPAQPATKEVQIFLCSALLFLRVLRHCTSKRENLAWRLVKFKLGAFALGLLIMIWLSMIRLENPSILTEGLTPQLIQWLIVVGQGPRVYCPQRRPVISIMCWKTLARCLERKFHSPAQSESLLCHGEPTERLPSISRVQRGDTAGRLNKRCLISQEAQFVEPL